MYEQAACQHPDIYKLLIIRNSLFSTLNKVVSEIHHVVSSNQHNLLIS
jgi:hypothetical protein